MLAVIVAGIAVFVVFDPHGFASIHLLLMLLGFLLYPCFLFVRCDPAKFIGAFQGLQTVVIAPRKARAGFSGFDNHISPGHPLLPLVPSRKHLFIWRKQLVKADMNVASDASENS